MKPAAPQAFEVPRDQSTAARLASLFREIVLVLGGVCAVHGLDDGVVRELAAGLERAWRRADAHKATARPPRPTAHPAITALLQLPEEDEP